MGLGDLVNEIAAICWFAAKFLDELVSLVEYEVNMSLFSITPRCFSISVERLSTNIYCMVSFLFWVASRLGFSAPGSPVNRDNSIMVFSSWVNMVWRIGVQKWFMVIQSP
jgi:hypothetical protein